MIIHVVQPNETIYSISDYYQLPVITIIQENGITNPDNLVIGQTIVIIYPKIVYTVVEGDTLEDIAYKNDTNVYQILRNNPYLSDREYIYPGEPIIISFETEKNMAISTSGYAYPFIDKGILKKTLPFLTYISILYYKITLSGDLIDIEDEEIIQMAKDYNVAPMMLIATFSESGTGSKEVSNNILNNMEVQERFIDNVVITLKSKGFYGVNIYIQYVDSENLTSVEQFLQRFTTRMHNEGFRVVLTVTPIVNFELTDVKCVRVDYSTIMQTVDALLIASYDWGFSYRPPASVTPVNLVRESLDYIVTTVPPEKIFLGLSIIGYNWPLPYIPSYTRGNAITTESAIELANEQGVEIQYDMMTQAPYFFYTEMKDDFHIVWFKDARSIDVIADLVPEYGFSGLSIWNIMQFFDQMWVVINVQYEIDKVL